LELLILYLEKKVYCCSFCPSKSYQGAWKDGSMVEGSGGPEQMSPELENKAFSAKSTQHMRLKCHKDSHNTVLETRSS
ncbi:MAG: hypothetical protein MJE68_28075, partial [Proteobacteria bacterium]|nr:hypothetical protein [Pseudomonadota bacterium]